jgi:molybdopterin converting factor subunit 1
MIIHLKLFAAARQAVDQELLELELADGATITDLKNELVKQFPQFESMREHLLVAVDAEYAKEDQVLMPGQEVALIPPVSGG